MQRNSPTKKSSKISASQSSSTRGNVTVLHMVILFWCDTGVSAKTSFPNMAELWKFFISNRIRLCLHTLQTADNLENDINVSNSLDIWLYCIISNCSLGNNINTINNTFYASWPDIFTIHNKTTRACQLHTTWNTAPQIWCNIHLLLWCSPSRYRF